MTDHNKLPPQLKQLYPRQVVLRVLLYAAGRGRPAGHRKTGHGAGRGRKLVIHLTHRPQPDTWLEAPAGHARGAGKQKGPATTWAYLVPTDPRAGKPLPGRGGLCPGGR